jgi:hypothetical protein
MIDFMCIEEFSKTWQDKNELQNIYYKNYLINGKLILLLSYKLGKTMPRIF